MVVVTAMAARVAGRQGVVVKVVVGEAVAVTVEEGWAEEVGMAATAGQGPARIA